MNRHLLLSCCYLEDFFVISEKLGLLQPRLRNGLDGEFRKTCPVSNLSFLSKIVEYATLDQLLSLLVQNRVIPTFQYTYRKFHTTEMASCLRDSIMTWY